MSSVYLISPSEESTIMVAIWKLKFIEYLRLFAATLHVHRNTLISQEDTGLSRRFQSPDGTHNLWGWVNPTCFLIYTLKAFGRD